MNKLKKKIYKINNIFNKIFKENYNQCLNYNWDNKPKRYEILNKIIQKKKFNNYLEIGCFKDENFNEIKIANKTGVDPVSGGTIRDTSDNFFLNNKIFFDIVFIDGLHLYEQVRKDIQNSLKFLNLNGVIVLHDCIPLKIRDQMIPRSHEHWNGDVWKAIVEARTFEDLDTYTILADQGLGIIFKRKNRNLIKIEKRNFKSLTFKEYYLNFKNFMNPIEEEEVYKLIT